MMFPRLARSLDDASAPVTFFFRDDDVGWADAQLFALCDRLTDRAPLDLAVIPAAISPPVARRLLSHRGRLAFHQHGYRHHDHQRTGRKCELSDDRGQADIDADLLAGRARLQELFGERLEPIFTPPWNRCGVKAALSLVGMGVVALSRDRSATSFGIPGLCELPVAVDWVRHRDFLDETIAAATVRSPVGIMLHHEVLDEADLSRLDSLVDLVTTHRRARFSPMAELVGAAGP